MTAILPASLERDAVSLSKAKPNPMTNPPPRSVTKPWADWVFAAAARACAVITLLLLLGIIRSLIVGAWLALAFILLYKIGDVMASSITTPFYLELGYSKTEIGAVVKLFGFWATIGGSLLGGVLILRIGMTRALWYFGALQMLSTLGFVALAYVGHNNAALAAVIALENFAGGLGTAAFVGFMGALTDKRFTATQYALLSSLMGVPRVLISAPAGVLAEAMGWPAFFTFCTLLAIPGLWMIRGIARLNVTQPAPK